jgi:hypothetical protein
MQTLFTSQSLAGMTYKYYLRPQKMAGTSLEVLTTSVEEEPHQDVDGDSTIDSALNYTSSSPHDNCAVPVVP